MLNDTGNSGILGVAEHGWRVYHNVLPVAAHWVGGQLVLRCTFGPV